MLYCPICNIEMLVVERHGIPIDCCPECQGLFLDCNELPKIVESEVIALLARYRVEAEQEELLRRQVRVNSAS